MQKKLIAVAVGGALSAIGAAPVLAQNATVNVFGTLYAEYSWIQNGQKQPGFERYQPYDHLQNPGSEIGFRGEEKLGGGTSVWFQCTSSIDYRGSNSSSSSNAAAGSTWCTRNSALGLKGNFGNVFYGNWTTPWNRINSAANVGSNDTGAFGNAHIIAGTSTTTGITSPSISPANVGNLCPAVYRRRQNNLITYETPNFAGVTVMGAMTVRNYASAATGQQIKARLWSLGVQYNNGPLFVGAAYEKHDNFYQHLAGTSQSGDDRGITFAAAYTLPNNLKLGGHYNMFKSNPNVGVETKVNTWHLGMDWMISGPHGMRAGYSHAGDVKDNQGSLGTIAMNARPNAAPNTAADMWQIRYVYAMSKRTEVNAGVSLTNNKANGTYETGGSSTAQFGGSVSRAYVMSLRHTF